MQAVSNNPGRKIIAMSADFVPSWVGPDEIIPLHTAYVQALATRYKGKLAAIEIWNEPFNNKFPNTTNVDTLVNFYLQMFSQAQKAIKAIDSKPQVIGPAWSSALELESIAMSTNKLATFDGWSWHDYSRGTYAPDVDYLSPYWIRSITKDHLIWNFGKLANLKSLFVDELGLYGHSALGSDLNTNIDTEFATTLDWYRGMCRAIKTTVMYHAAGVSCIISHVFPLGDNLSESKLRVVRLGRRPPWAASQDQRVPDDLLLVEWREDGRRADHRQSGLPLHLETPEDRHPRLCVVRGGTIPHHYRPARVPHDRHLRHRGEPHDTR